MKKVVISLGGSLIIPDKIDEKFLRNFKKTVNNFSKKNKIVIITGGGKISRDYMDVLDREGLSIDRVCLMGMMATKMNAFLVSNFLNANKTLPNSLTEIKNLLKKYNLVVCGSIGYHPDMTSDGTAALIAHQIKADYFINITNVNGLYNKDPRKNRDAKLIRKISFMEFSKIVDKVHYRPGQHFVLDQSGARIIRRYKIITYIIGKDLRNLEKLLTGKKFVSTEIG